jgi:hypothetical protein
MTLSLTYLRDPSFADATVLAGVTAALTDPDTGLLGVSQLGIGQAIYDSQIEAACLAVPGVVAVHNLSFAGVPAAVPRFRPFIIFRAPNLKIVPTGCTGRRHDPGAGNYFSLDPVNDLYLTGQPAS